MAGPEPRKARENSAGLAVIGAHGRAGTTTLAKLLPAHDLGRVSAPARRPGPEPGVPVPSPRQPLPQELASRLLLVTHSTTWAASLAADAVQNLAGTGRRVDALVIIDDGWADSPEAAALFATLTAAISAVVRVPHVPALRDCGDPLTLRLPRRYHRALNELRALEQQAAIRDPGKPHP